MKGGDKMKIISIHNGFQYILTDKNDIFELKKMPENKEITNLCLTSNRFKTNLDILGLYPNISELTLIGDFGNYQFVRNFHLIESLELYLRNADYSEYESLMTSKLNRLDIRETREITDLNFISKAVNLKRLYLNDLPNVTSLPEFNEISVLKIYGLHKLNNIESLVNSKIQYISLALCADKISGTKIADTLIKMKELKKVDISHIDRGGRRDEVVENRLKKYNLQNLIDRSCYV